MPSPNSFPPASASHVEIPAEVVALYAPRENLRVSQWVEKYRRLHEKDAAEAGAFSYETIPYMVEPTDALTWPGVASIMLVKASRCSGTELINNHLAYSIDARSMPCGYVLPRDDDVEEEFKGRLRRLIETSPQLARHIPGGNWATEGCISLDSMTVQKAAVTVANDFIRRTWGLALVDEVDNCGDGAMRSRLGDVWELVSERLTTFGHRARKVGVSTPMYADGAGWRAYLAGDRRKYWCPCPRCGVYQVLRFDQIRLRPEHADERNPDKIKLHDLAGYVCENPACEAWLPTSEKLWMTRRGLWVPECQQIAGKLDVTSKELVERAYFRHPDRFLPPLRGAPPLGVNLSYWIDAAVSPWRTFSAFLAKFFASLDDRDKLKVFRTHWQALPWEESTQAVKADELRVKVETGHPPDLVPDRAVTLIAYADVQGAANGFHYQVWAFGPGEEAWLVHYGHAESFEQCEERTLDAEYPYADGKCSLRCIALGYDTGDGNRTNEIYERQRLRPHEIVLTKGWEELKGGEKWRPANVEFYPSGRKDPHSVRLYHLSTAFFKGKLLQLYTKPGDGPGVLHLHKECSAAFLDQLTSEHLVYRRPKKKPKGRWVWAPKTEGRANHHFDVLVGIYAIADIKGFRRLSPRDVFEAKLSQAKAGTGAGGAKPAGTGVRTPDGRAFFATQRR